MMRRVSLATVTLFLVLGVASAALAQLASQTALVGTVSDSGGGILPGAQIVAVNVGTNDTYETTTNAEGYYNIQFVRPGRYDITITITGFQTFKATGVDVNTNQVVRTNATMQVGGLTESVSVDASAQVLNTDSATVSETIGEKAIVDLPLSGRNVWSLASTTPGVLGGLNSDIGLSFRGAGQREIQNSLALDGINSSSNLLAATSMRPIADAVEEVQVQTGSTSAEYGSYLGVHINVVTKSGTNRARGSVFEYYQGDALDARGHFENRANPKNPRKRNQFGFQMDGPVVIPKLYDGRNKTFFMGAYEGVRAEALSTPFNTVPTAQMRAGNFSEVTATQIRVPGTGAGTPNPAVPFPGNIIPPGLISPVSLKLLDYYPATNLSGITNNLQAQSANGDNVDQLLLRGDQNVGNKARLSLRYNWHDSYNSNIGAIPVQGVTQPRVNHNTLFSYTHTLRPTLHNDFRIGYHRIDFDTLNHFEVNGIPSAGADLGIPGFDGDVQVQQPGAADGQHQQLQRARPGRHQLVSVRHHLPGLERDGLHGRLAQRQGRVRPAPADDRPARGEQPARPVRVHRRVHRLRDGRLHARAAAHGDSADRSDPGPRRRLAQRLLRQRRLAGDAGLHGQPRPALREQHAGADLRGPGVDARHRLRDDHPEQLPGQGLRVPRAEQQGHRAAARGDVPDRREDRGPGRLRDLLQPEPDELVHVPHQQPAGRGGVHLHVRSGQPDALVLPAVRRGDGGGAEHDLADRAICRTRARISGASTSSGSCGAAPRSISSTSARIPSTSIAASTTTRRRPVPARSIRGVPARSSASAASSRTTWSPTTTRSASSCASG